MTIAQTQGEWYEKLKSWVPAWVLREERYAKAYFMALSKSASVIQGLIDDAVADTFIMRSEKGVLDTHGAERSVERLADELDSSYAVRVQNLLNKSNVQALKAFIDRLLLVGTARIQEDFDSVIFCSRENFANRASLFIDTPILNTFSIVVDRQVVDDPDVATRDQMFELIKKVVDDHKALGTLYRVNELLE